MSSLSTPAASAATPTAVTAPPAAASPPAGRADYPHFLAIPTRWMDNDVYGHVNNVVYYSYFDTVINEHLIREGLKPTAIPPAIRQCLQRLMA
ncbi:MAG: thioesterase [Rhodocyclaceae bacterium]|nr:thioesterase [Rhodocyclaceae bacterium]